MTGSHGPAGRGSTARTALIAVATFGLGALGTFLLVAHPGDPRSAPRDDARGAGEVAAELASMRAELERLRRVVEGANPTLAVPSTEPRRENVAANAELEAIVSRFERALATLERPASAAAPPRVPGQGRPSRAELEGEVGARLSEDFHGLCDDLSRAHYLWTVDEVLARYGMPNRRGGADDLSLMYGLGGDDSAEPANYVMFQVHDGRVTSVYVETD